MIKNLPAMQKTQVSTPGLGRSLGGGHGNSLQYSLENSRDGEPSGLQSMEVQRVRHD